MFVCVRGAVGCVFVCVYVHAYADARVCVRVCACMCVREKQGRLFKITVWDLVYLLSFLFRHFHLNYILTEILYLVYS